MTRSLPFQAAVAAALLFIAGAAHAIQTCELDGQSINPNNGVTTAGKTGLMRCKDADTGVIAREQELRNGKFMGVVRYFKNGLLEREYSVDERGNRSGVSREWAIDAGGQRVLVREETNRDSRAIGIVRTWYPTGQRRRLAFHGDDEREQASVEFTTDGKLYELRCAARPVFGSDFDDKAACGHAGSVSAVLLYNGKGQPQTRIAFERGERRKVESLWDNGSVRELRETSASGVLERGFAADGTKLREVQWTTLPPRDGDTRPRNLKVLEQEFHTSGKLVRETRWAPNARGGADLLSEARWYLNGQAKERVDYADADGKRTRRETRFHDNGKPAFEGSWLIAGSGLRGGEQALGSHKSFDDQGRVRSERVFDDGGRIAREREFDERGVLVRDDEVFEDGSRKSLSR